MTTPVFGAPSDDEQFYARALAILAGPTRRVAVVLRICSLVYWLAVIGALGWLLSQVFDRDPPVIMRSTTLLTPTVAPGEPARVAYVIERKRTCETDISWSIYDGAEEIHRFGPLHVAASGPPGPDRFIRAWPTPTNAASGRGRLRVILAFECPGNYLQAIYPVTLVLPDLPLEIVKQERLN